MDVGAWCSREKESRHWNFAGTYHCPTTSCCYKRAFAHTGIFLTVKKNKVDCLEVFLTATNTEIHGVGTKGSPLIILLKGKM
ncbi:hypothetical protein AMECASPLE_018616 [Ameca splendens]|uniref:Uncharacterized protein n=1 Tax=Ameca splendens TaxID=208324 RepID=A0ABV0YE12_9TELE